jgi:DNA-binding response OmpR family regulator
MQMILRQGAELRVVTAETSEEALEMARQRKFDVVTSDINRSGMNGLEFLRVFKQAHPTTPVIIVSAAVGEVMRQAKWLRAFACLSKPFACPELVALVRAAIASKKLCRTAVLSRRLGRFTTAA